MRNWVARQFAYWTFWLYTLPRRTRNWWAVRIQHRDLELTLVCGEEFPSGRVAVVATYPRQGVEGSVARLLRYLSDAGYHPVLVVGRNSLADDWVDRLGPEAGTVFVRESIGRDMGAFRSVVLHWREAVDTGRIVRLAFFNDSAFYTPRSQAFMRSYLASDAGFLSMFTNLQVQPHVQSFAMVFGREVLTSDWFWRYWERYYSSNERRPSILRGEILLSRVAFASGVRPSTFVTEDLIDSLLRSSPDSATLAEQFALESHTLRLGELGAWAAQRLLVEGKSPDQASFRLLVRHALSVSNPTHSVGLLAARVGAPLKLDLAKAGTATIGDVIATLADCEVPPEELAALRGTLEVVGTPVSAVSFHKRWRDHGLE